jgi:hypothetical protein
MAPELGDVRYWKNSGKHMLAGSFSGFDPTPDIAPCRCYAALMHGAEAKPGSTLQ